MIRPDSDFKKPPDPFNQFLEEFKELLEEFGIEEHHLKGIKLSPDPQKRERAIRNLVSLLTATRSPDEETRKAAEDIIRRYKEWANSTRMGGGLGDFNNLGEIPEGYFRPQKEGEKPPFVDLAERTGLEFLSRYGHIDFSGLPSPKLLYSQKPSCFGKFILPLLKTKKEPRFLDAGCGYGRAVEEVMKINPQAKAIGIDLIPYPKSWHSIMKKEDGRARFLIGDLLTPPFPPESFDVIFSNNTLMYPLDKFGFILSLLELLNIGGVLYINAASYEEIGSCYFSPPLSEIIKWSGLNEVIKILPLDEKEERRNVFACRKIAPLDSNKIRKPTLIETQPVGSFGTKSIYRLE